MKIVIVGDGGQSKVIQDMLAIDETYEVVGILDDKYDDVFQEKSITYGPISMITHWSSDDVKVVLAIGNNTVRRKLNASLPLKTNQFVTIIHPKAVVSPTARIDVGTVIMAHAVINADTTIGKHCIINTGAVVEHENVIGDFTHVSPNATLTGNVSVGEGVHIGAQATVIPGMKIGSWSVIGAGSTVIRPIPVGNIAVGSPARLLKRNNKLEEKGGCEVNRSKIYLSPPHMSGKELDYIQEAYRTNWIAPLGESVDAFEKEIANYVGVKEAVALSSGTAAIHLALSLLDVKQEDTVFCSTFTFIASANPILYQGGKPVFIDSEPNSWNMSPQALKRALQNAAHRGKLPKAVIIVNLYGQSAKMDELVSLCNAYHVPVIEDAAESLGSRYKGKKSGSFGKFGIFSFNGNKIITTSGGGMLVSNDTKAIERARFLATQARDPSPYYQHSVKGYNYRMSNILASIGRAQLHVLDNRVEKRRRNFERYVQNLSHLPGVTFMPELPETKSNRWLTTLTINESEAGVSVSQLLEALHRQEIEARPVWKPLHLQPLFEGVSYYSHGKKEHVAEHLFSTGLCLPSGSSLTVEQQDRVINCITETINGTSKKKEMILENLRYQT